MVTQLIDEIVAKRPNSGEPEMVIPSQAEEQSSGVCREHGAASKEMICSDTLLKSRDYSRSDTNNWFMSDYSLQKEFLLWWNREPIQFFQDKDSNTMVAIYLSYYRVGTGWEDWRWGFGQLV